MPMTLIQRQILSGNQASISFNNIPQNYQTLKILISSRDDYVWQAQDVQIRFNTDSSSNYNYRRLAGGGSSAASDSGSSQTFGTSAARNTSVGSSAGLTSAYANVYSSCEITIPNYSGSNVKIISSDAVTEGNTTYAYQGLNAVLWNLTSSIQSMTLFPQTATNFVSGSTFSLYGIS